MAPRKALGKAASKIGALIDDQLARNNMTEEQAAVARRANRSAPVERVAPVEEADPIDAYLAQAEITDPKMQAFVRDFVDNAHYTEDADSLYELMRTRLPKDAKVVDPDAWFDELLDLAEQADPGPPR